MGKFDVETDTGKTENTLDFSKFSHLCVIQKFYTIFAAQNSSLQNRKIKEYIFRKNYKNPY